MSAESLLYCPSCKSNVKDPQNKIISQETKDLIDKLLLEKIPLAGIARATEVSERSAYAQIVVWRRLAKHSLCALQSYVNAKYESVSQQVK